MTGVHEGHRNRLKKQFSEHGGLGMNDIQFLEMLLYYAIPRRDTNELAHALLERYGTIRGVLDAPAGDLVNVPGIGDNAALFIEVVREALQRYVTSPNKETNYIFSSSDAGKYLVPILRYERTEKVYLMCLNGRGAIISCGEIASGTLSTVNVSIRKIVDIAMRSHSTSVVLAHNHPAGFALPSTEDRAFTYELKHALGLMDIQLKDHILVADGDYVSFAQSGYL
ncbi:MAG: DNA repair protein RadC [Oscillospiraceae bacterium]|nr:DNA repair protein RadC [Oscillospiraceae bacterium]